MAFLRRHIPGFQNRKWQLVPAGKVRHTVTYRAITVLPFLIDVKKLPLITGAKQVPLRDISSLPVSNLTRKVARAALAAQPSFPPGAESNPFAPPPFRGALQVLR